MIAKRTKVLLKKLGEEIACRGLTFNPHMNKENQEWEDRFEFDFLHRSGSCAYNLIAICSAEEQRIKFFIQSELSKAREEERERIKGILEKQKGYHAIGNLENEYDVIYNEALTDAIKVING